MYLLLGAGRLSRHLSYYFKLKGIEHLTWARSDGESNLRHSLVNAKTVLFLVTDDQILNLRNQYSWGDRTLVHCSGSLAIDKMESAHPLFSFASNEPHSLEIYESIPFITEKGKLTFNQIFPELTNAAFQIDPKLKPLYHALCVSSGNFTQVLWRLVSERFEKELNLPPEILGPYLSSVYWSLRNDPGTALTGPLARRDLGTMESNIAALDGSKLEEIYRAFVKVFEIDLSQRREVP